MSFTNAVRAVLREAGEPLTGTEIAERIKQGYPRYYNTQAQRDNYKNSDDGLRAQIATTAIHARDIHRDSSVRPMLISLVEESQIVPSPQAEVESDILELADADYVRENFAEIKHLPPGERDHFTLKWSRCESYEAAKDYYEIIYLHEWCGKPFYWGIARTYFGGSRRELRGSMVSGRYNSGYRHWIEGSLQHGAFLYVAKILEGDVSRLQEVENYLICTYGHEANRRELTIVQALNLSHRGDVPYSIGNDCSLCSGKAA